MQTQKAQSNCTRCGNPRIIVDTYTEKVDSSTVTYTITKCSDPKCQEAVDKLLKGEEEKRKIIKEEQVKRETIRLKALEEKKAKKGFKK